jgi:hypothetical protein
MPKSSLAVNFTCVRNAAAVEDWMKVVNYMLVVLLTMYYGILIERYRSKLADLEVSSDMEKQSLKKITNVARTYPSNPP